MVAVDPYTVGQIVTMVVLSYYLSVMLLLGAVGAGVLRGVNVWIVVMAVCAVVAVGVVQFSDVRIGAVMFMNGVLMVLLLQTYAELVREVVVQW